MNWIPLDKEMPPQYKPVLVSDGVDVWSASWSMWAGNVLWTCHGFTGYDMQPYFGYPVAWCDLPEPSKEGKK